MEPDLVDDASDDPVGGLDEGPQRPESTGHGAVDEVLDALAGLDDRPLEEHVTTLEQAHEALRRALDGAGGPAVPTPPAG